MAESGEKKHEATPHRRQKAREQGQVARSHDLGSALVLLLAVSILWWWGPKVLYKLAELMISGFQQPRYWTLDPHSAAGLVAASLIECLWALLPIMVAVCAVALINNWFQVGILFLPEKVNFDFSRINPVSGAKRLFALPNFARLGFGLLKIGLVVCVIAFGLWGKWAAIQNAHMLTTGEIGGLVWNTTMDLCIRTAVILLLLAVFDYAFQWWKMEQDLRMTDEELREEIKQMNGDPQIIARRRAVQRQLALNRIQNAVPEADVVITNPTELAIAIKFDIATMTAPIVVAKGAGHVAARIRKLALSHGIPVLERKPLAQALFKLADIGQPIPVEQYAAVAEVLRYVYQLQGRKLPTLENLNARRAA
ncbi:MAG: EscU/YscU/HrcU family type III secretion system export apparatus switch protein [Planctomycetales bacterium]|nr:EscU/YscU/HrcU family type III secretion system export apparatus switch protein [Planctomycetales bacterium]